jgi:hypothetical protein
MDSRAKALRKLRHAFFYLQSTKGTINEPATDLLLEKYRQVRGEYDFRRTGHGYAKCCKRYTQLVA